MLIVSLLVLTDQIQQTQCNDQDSWDQPIDIEGPSIRLHMDETADFTFYISNLPKSFLQAHNATIHFASDSEILTVSGLIPLDAINDENRWKGNVTLYAEFIGRVNIYVRATYDGDKIKESVKLPIVIVREERIIDKVFVISVASLMTILYINFGAALDLQNVKSVLVRPVGPGIAFFCHFIVLPLVNFTRFLITFFFRYLRKKLFYFLFFILRSLDIFSAFSYSRIV